MSTVQRDLDAEVLGRVQIGTRVCDAHQVGEVIAVTRMRVTVQYPHTAESAIACRCAHWRKVYRRIDGRSVGGKQISWARLAA